MIVGVWFGLLLVGLVWGWGWGAALFVWLSTMALACALHFERRRGLEF